MKLKCILAAVCLLATSSLTGAAATIENGVLMVDGRPFFPLGSWSSSLTTGTGPRRAGHEYGPPGGARGSEERVQRLRQFTRECRELGIYVTPYLSYGGAMTTPWSEESVRRIATLAEEPNLLAWYVGDDLGPQHLPGLVQTVTTLREVTPGVPTGGRLHRRPNRRSG